MLKLLITVGSIYLFIIIFIILSMLIWILIDKWNWNKGKCRKCGGEWIFIGNTVEEGSEYHCNCGRKIVIQYHS